MRVLLSTTAMHEERTVGGVLRYALELHHGLAVEHVTTEMLTGVHSCPALEGLERSTGWYRPAVPSKLKLAATLAVETALAPRHDVVHRLSYPPRRARTGRAPLLVTIYDMIPELFPEQFPTVSRIAARKRFWCQRADAVIAISETTAADVVTMLGIDARKVRAIPLGARPVPPATSSTPPRRDDLVLHVGTRHGYKNFGLLAHGFAQARHTADLHLVCAGPPATQEETDLLDRLGVSSRVTFCRPSDDELAALYRSATVTVCPSRYEGFGLPVLEAMGHRSPVIAAKAGSLPEVAGGAALLVDPDAPEELAAALDRLLEDTALRARLVEQGNARAVAYPWERTVAATAAVYREVA